MAGQQHKSVAIKGTAVICRQSMKCADRWQAGVKSAE
jgi:hypothetical protein